MQTESSARCVYDAIHERTCTDDAPLHGTHVPASGGSVVYDIALVDGVVTFALVCAALSIIHFGYTKLRPSQKDTEHVTIAAT